MRAAEASRAGRTPLGHRVARARKRRSDAGLEETAPLRLGEKTTGGEEEGDHRPSTLFGCPALPGRGGAWVSACEWSGIGSAIAAVRRAEARRNRGGSAFPVTRSGSPAGPSGQILSGHRQ